MSLEEWQSINAGLSCNPYVIHNPQVRPLMLTLVFN